MNGLGLVAKSLPTGGNTVYGRVSRVTNTCRAACVLLLIGLLMGSIGRRVPAQAAQGAIAATSDINADSKPYHMEWNGAVGSFSQEALGVDVARKMPMVFLHSDVGPKGYAKYNAWFLVRDGQSFSLLWCYLNDSGTEFYAWLYHYPVNQWTSLHFTGNYRFSAPSEPVAPIAVSDLKPATVPHYSGPDFVFGNWTRRAGAMAKLNLLPAPSTFSAPLTDRNGATPSPASQPVKTLTDLRTYPLSMISVPSGNGWLPSGWRELHALAYDSANDPYYLILYTHVTRGYVIDLKRAQIYVADYGQKVTFSQTPSTYGQDGEQVTGPPDSQVLRYTRREIEFTATGTYANPYNEVYLDVQFRAPNGKQLTVPGFWDSGNIWRARIAPTLVGRWTWKTVSSDPGMNRQEGSFACVSSPTEGKGFLAVNVSSEYKHQFSNSDGSPFFPVFVAYPVHHMPDSSAPDKATTAVRLTTAANQATPDSFTRFQRDVDALAQSGFNRFIGENLIDPTGFAAKTQQNEGGAPFISYDPDHINPAYFQAMDRRLAYVNDKGIVPDVGLGQFGSGLLDLLTPAQLNRLWRYTIARYAAYNVSWVPFGRAMGKPLPPEAAPLIESIQRTVFRNDPVRHPITLILAGGVEVPRKPARVGTANNTAPSVPPADADVSDLAGYVNTAAPPPASGGFVRMPEDQPVESTPNGGTPRSGRSAAPPVTLPGQAGNQNVVVDNAQGVTGSASGSATASGTSARSTKPSSSKNTKATQKTGASKSTKAATGAPTLSITPGVPGRNLAPQAGAPNGGPGGFPGGFPGGPPNGGPGGFPGFPDGGQNGFPGGPGGAQDLGAFFRGRNRGAGRTQSQTVPTGFIESPAGLPLGPASTTAAKPTGPQVTLGPVPSWLDIITLDGGPVAAVSTAYNMDKPVVIYDGTVPTTPGGARYRLWTTLMSGGYWADDVAGIKPEAVIDSQETRWAAYAGRLFARTRYWRLAPHSEILGGLQESAFERRRRRQAETEAAKTAPVPDAAQNIDPIDPGGNDSSGNNKPQSGPIYILADPGWEYVVYFQQGGLLTIDLLEATGRIATTWFNPRTGEFSAGDTVLGGAFRSFRAPDDNDWALIISRR
jgi:hypothetical protein